jgi:hypothetical protein
VCVIVAGAIAGIIVGAACALLALIAGVLVLALRRKQRARETKQQQVIAWHWKSERRIDERSQEFFLH